MQPLDESPASPLQPTASSERIVTLDVLRGIALFGVLAANIWMWFSGLTFLFPAVRQELQRVSLNSMAFLFVAIFISGKAVRTFSFLFGLGFALQMTRAEVRGRPVTAVYRRRLLVLLCFGILHAVLLWYGDILTTYAILGIGLLLFQHTSLRTAAVWAIVMIILVPLAPASIPLIQSVRGVSAPATSPAALGQQNQATLKLFSSGEPSQIVRGNLRMLKQMYVTPRALGVLELFGFFLLGFCAGRLRLFERVALYRKQLRLLIMIGFPIGIVFALMEVQLRMTFGPRFGGVPPPWFSLAVTAAEIISATPFALAYIAAATLLMEHTRWKSMLGPFAPVGRMALTNYLSQTFLCLAIFYWGGLLGTFRPALALLIAVMMFAVQMWFSAWWLSRYRFGPMEWLWRSLTYGRRQPMRIARLGRFPATVGAH